MLGLSKMKARPIVKRNELSVLPMPPNHIEIAGDEALKYGDVIYATMGGRWFNQDVVQGFAGNKANSIAYRIGYCAKANAVKNVLCYRFSRLKK